MNRILLSLLLLLFSRLLPAQSVDSRQETLDQYFSLLAENDQLMAGFALSQGGEVVYENYLGQAQAGVPNTATTRFRIGSISKTFTTVLLFQQIEAGKLSLTDPLSQFLPDFPRADSLTIDHLVSHRSGIFNFTNDPAYPEYMTEPISREKQLEIIAGYEPVFAPGEKAEYSNSNFLLLGYLLEDLTGKSLAEQIEQGIAQPLGLKLTAYGGPIGPGDAAPFLPGENGDWVPAPVTDMSVPGGAGAVVSTPRELITFIEALFAGELVSPSSLAKMQEIRDGFGRGLFAFPFNEKRALGHNGGIDEFVAHVSYLAEDSLSLALTTNGGRFPMNQVLVDVLSIWYGLPFELPDFSAEETTYPAETLEPLSGHYTCPDIPINIDLQVVDGQLQARGSGQPPFLLTAFDDGSFRFAPAGIMMAFPQEEGAFVPGSFTLKQGGGRYEFSREE